MSIRDVDAIAATAGPGLIGGVMVALLAGKGLALAAGKPLIAVNHLEGHALSPAARRSGPRLSLSAAAGVRRALPVARGARSRRLSPARDHHRRCGGRGVRQGGQAAWFALSRRPGDRGAGEVGRPRTPCRCRGRWSARASRISPSPGSRARFSAQSPQATFEPEDIAASFQQAVVDCLVDRTRLALRAQRRADARGRGRRRRQSGHPQRACRPRRGAWARASASRPRWLCTDNAAMIAWAGAERFAAGDCDASTSRRARAGRSTKAPRRCAARE